MARDSQSINPNRTIDTILILVVFALGIILGYSLLPVKEPAANTGQLIKANCPEITQGCLNQSPNTPVPQTTENSVTIQLPAVDAEGNGSIIPLTVQKRPGNGETLIDINNLVFWFDTQQSIQTAKNVAREISGVDTGRINIVYVANTEAGLVGGPSAGAALTIATVAVLKDEELNNSVMITGTINPDGSIGPVGGIFHKALAAKGAGAKLFLVPVGQLNETTSEPRQTCTRRYGFNYCRTQYYETTIDVSEAAGIPVKEVSKISDAMSYFGIS